MTNKTKITKNFNRNAKLYQKQKVNHNLIYPLNGIVKRNRVLLSLDLSIGVHEDFENLASILCCTNSL